MVGVAVVLGLLVLVGIWAVLSAPEIHPRRCYLPEVACGLRDCGGPCRPAGERLPCEVGP